MQEQSIEGYSASNLSTECGPQRTPIDQHVLFIHFRASSDLGDEINHVLGQSFLGWQTNFTGMTIATIFRNQNVCPFGGKSESKVVPVINDVAIDAICC